MQKQFPCLEGSVSEEKRGRLSNHLIEHIKLIESPYFGGMEKQSGRFFIAGRVLIQDTIRQLLKNKY